MNTHLTLEIVAVALWLLVAVGLTYLTPNGITDKRFTEDEEK